MRAVELIWVAPMWMWASVSGVMPAAYSQQSDVESSVAVGSGWHAQYEMHADPENANNMILCGYKGDPKDNALYGFVYSSSDGGKTWRYAFEPKNSTFESEGSCAFGVHGVAYYVNSASNVIDGEAHHAQGTTRIYVSHDSGRTWKLSTTTGWTDWSTSVVDPTPGPNENRLYVFFNSPSLFLTSVGELKQSKDTGGWLGMISYKDGDPHVAGPFSTSGATRNEKYVRGASFPGPSIRVKDGSIVTISSGKRRSENSGRELFVEAIRTAPDRNGLEDPVKVVSSLDSPSDESHIPCGGYFLDPAATYDSARDKLYFAYSDVADKTCELFLTASTDEGKSWSKPAPIYSFDATPDRQYANPAIAVNKDGVLALMWRNSFRSGCWMFATSSDDGKTLSRAQPIGSCRKDQFKPSELSTAYLWTSFFQARPEESVDTARINLRNTRNGVMGRNQDAIAVTADGSFQVVWIDAGNGEGEVRTAAIHVTPSTTLISDATAGLVDITDRIAVLYGGDQSFDPRNGILTLGITIKNKSAQVLTGPFKLIVTSLRQPVGEVDIANADNGATGAGAAWDLTTSVPSGALVPGTVTKKFSLKFHYLVDPDTPRDSDDILRLNVRVYGKP